MGTAWYLKLLNTSRAPATMRSQSEWFFFSTPFHMRPMLGVIFNPFLPSDFRIRLYLAKGNACLDFLINRFFFHARTVRASKFAPCLTCHCVEFYKRFRLCLEWRTNEEKRIAMINLLGNDFISRRCVQKQKPAHDLFITSSKIHPLWMCSFFFRLRTRKSCSGSEIGSEKSECLCHCVRLVNRTLIRFRGRSLARAW